MEQARRRVLVTGATGLVGRKLVPALEAAGATVVTLGRGTESDLGWDPRAGRFPEVDALRGLAAVFHLAGAGIAEARWTAKRKAEIWQSRVAATQGLAERIVAAGGVPVWVGASGVARVPTTGGPWAEDAAPGTGFLADLVGAWEAATGPVQAAGTRVVAMRFGVILTAEGGALAKMLPAFRWGLGGPLGTGRQAFPWLASEDAVALLVEGWRDARFSGPIHALAPETPTQAEFARTLGAVLGRPAILPLPAFAVRLLFGEMGEQALLAGPRAAPARLRALGYSWRQPDLAAWLRLTLGRPA